MHGTGKNESSSLRMVLVENLNQNVFKKWHKTSDSVEYYCGFL